MVKRIGATSPHADRNNDPYKELAHYLSRARSFDVRSNTHTVLLRIVSLRVKAIHLGSVSSAVLSRFFSCCLVSSEIGSPCICSKLRFESSGPRSVHARNRTFSPAARQRQWSPCRCLIVYT